MPLFAVIYRYADDSVEARNEHRLAHMDFLNGLYRDGHIVRSGRLAGEDRPSALLLLRADSARDVEQLLDADPFRGRGLVAEREVREWTVVFGKED